MAKFKFDPKATAIICRAEIVGRKRELSLKMIVDTGATYTIIPVEAAVAIGYDPSRSPRKIEITTGSSIEYVSIVSVPKFRAFGIEIRNMKAVCHNLPPESPVDGLLGLNFLRQAKIAIDFSQSAIITPG
mgnify:CR=1